MSNRCAVLSRLFATTQLCEAGGANWPASALHWKRCQRLSPAIMMTFSWRCFPHYLPTYVKNSPGPWFNIKISSYQYRKSHCGDKTIVRSSCLHNGISYTGKMTSLYWIRAQFFTEMHSNVIFVFSLLCAWIMGEQTGGHFLTWISCHTPNKVWDEITYPFLNFHRYTVEVCEWLSQFILHFVMDVITYSCGD